MGPQYKGLGRWDFKRKSEPFNKPEQYPSFFYYRGHNGKYRLENTHHKSGSLRYDDTGNMCYGATGKVMLSEANSYYREKRLCIKKAPLSGPFIIKEYYSICPCANL